VAIAPRDLETDPTIVVRPTSRQPDGPRPPSNGNRPEEIFPGACLVRAVHHMVSHKTNHHVVTHESARRALRRRTSIHLDKAVGLVG